MVKFYLKNVSEKRLRELMKKFVDESEWKYVRCWMVVDYIKGLYGSGGICEKWVYDELVKMGYEGFIEKGWLDIDYYYIVNNNGSE